MAEQTALPTKVSFVNLDYDALVAEIRTRIPFVFPEWKDVLDSNVGMGLLRLVAYLISVQTFYTDRQAAECFIDTALVPENIYRLAKLVGFQPVGYYSAEGVAKFSLPGGAHTQDIIIPKGTAVSSASVNTVPFSTVETVILSAGETSVEVRIIQGARATEVFVANGEKFQRVRLASKAVAFNSVEVLVSDTPQTEVRTFVEQAATAQVFRVLKDHLDNVFVEFGDGREGAAPADGAEISVSYHDSIGTLSEIPTGAISTISAQLLDVLGAPVTVTVTNTAPISGGATPETPDDIKLFVPGTFRAQERAVTKQDYAVEAERYPGVAGTQVLDTDDDDEIPLGHVHVYTIGKPGITIDDSFAMALRSRLAQRAVSTIRPRVIAATKVPINVTMTVNYFSSYNPETVRAGVIAGIRERLLPAVHPQVRAEAGLATTGAKIGETVFASSFGALALEVPGVHSVTVTAPTTDTQMQSGEIGVAGAITVNVGQSY